LDAHGAPTPIGIPGELHIGGSMLARGYHRRPELTAARFIQNPFSDQPDSRLYRTGDLVRYLEDGSMEFLGRIDDQVKIRGFRIELGEVEAALRKHPAVREALVLAREESGSKRLVAYVTKSGEAVSPAALRMFLKTALPEYMVPSAVAVLEKWPLLPNGKIDRRGLPEPEQESGNSENIQGPRDPLELQLQLLFERVLKRAPIDIHASFFELGGDSLQALELLVEIEKAAGRQLPLGTLYQSSTVEALAREVRGRASSEEWSSLVPLQTSGKRPPLILLHTTPGDILGYGNLVYRLGSEQPCYGFQSLGLKDSRLSHRSVPEMARYYVDLLRTSFPCGPYYLGGWCYGGIVAVEMARMLKKQGQEVAMVALLETVAMPPSLRNLKYLRHRARCLVKMSPQRWIEYVREKARYRREARIANKMRFRQADSSRAGDSAGEIIDPRLAKLEHVYNTNLKALNNYKTEYYNGGVTLFNAAEKDPALIPDPHYGWVGLAKEIEIVEVPGNHDTMLFEPNVSVLARRLNACLEAARKKYEEIPR
jgi:aspartate racemase